METFKQNIIDLINKGEGEMTYYAIICDNSSVVKVYTEKITYKKPFLSWKIVSFFKSSGQEDKNTFSNNIRDISSQIQFDLSNPIHRRRFIRMFFHNVYSVSLDTQLQTYRRSTMPYYRDDILTLCSVYYYPYTKPNKRRIRDKLRSYETMCNDAITENMFNGVDWIIKEWIFCYNLLNLYSGDTNNKRLGELFRFFTIECKPQFHNLSFEQVKKCMFEKDNSIIPHR